jgi:hypothetical protein
MKYDKNDLQEVVSQMKGVVMELTNFALTVYCHRVVSD